MCLSSNEEMEKERDSYSAIEKAKVLKKYLKKNEKEISFFNGTRIKEIDENEKDPTRLLSALHQRYMIKNREQAENLIDILTNPKKIYKDLDEYIKTPFLEKDEKKVRMILENIGKMIYRIQRQIESNLNETERSEDKTEKEIREEILMKRLTSLSRLEPLERLDTYLKEVENKDKEDTTLRYIDNKEKIMYELMGLRRRIHVYFRLYTKTLEQLVRENKEIKEVQETFKNKNEEVKKFIKKFRKKILENEHIKEYGIPEEKEIIETLYPKTQKEEEEKAYVPYPYRANYNYKSGEEETTDLPKTLGTEIMDERISYILMDESTMKKVFDITYKDKKDDIKSFREDFIKETHREYMKKPDEAEKEIQEKAKKLQAFIKTINTTTNIHAMNANDKKKISEKTKNFRVLDTLHINLRECVAIEMINNILKLNEGFPQGLEIRKSGMEKDMKKIDCELMHNEIVIKNFDLKIANKDRFEYKKKDNTELRVPRDLVYAFMKEFIPNVIYKLESNTYNKKKLKDDIFLALSQAKKNNTYKYDELVTELKEECNIT